MIIVTVSCMFVTRMRVPVAFAFPYLTVPPACRYYRLRSVLKDRCFASALSLVAQVSTPAVPLRSSGTSLCYNMAIQQVQMIYIPPTNTITAFSVKVKEIEWKG